MAGYIAYTIEQKAKKSIAKGQAQYKAYFITTTKYEEFRADVDLILTADGYEDVIISG